jgi:hypothetical protein
VGSAGALFELQLGGTGDQITRGLAASDDGSLWLSLSSFEEQLGPRRSRSGRSASPSRASTCSSYVLKLALWLATRADGCRGAAGTSRQEIAGPPRFQPARSSQVRGW